MGVLKLGGIASGLDTEGLIKTLMALEQKPVQGLQTRSDTLTSRANAWRDLNTRLLSLQKRFQELQGLAESGYLARKASSADTSVLSVSATTSSAVTGTYSVEVVKLAKATVWQQGQMADGVLPDPDLIASPDTDLGVQGVIKVASGPASGKTFTVQATDSLNDIAKTINDNKDTLGFSAAVMQVAPGDYRLVLTGKNGLANDFTLDNGDGNNAASKLMLTAATATKQAGDDAQVKVNGMTVTAGDNVIVDAIGGVTFTAAKIGTTTVTVSKDFSQVVSAVQKVVDQYNSVMELVDLQTSYDAKTKQAGPLFGDNRLRDLVETLRSKLFKPVSPLADDVESLQMIGLTTVAFKAGEKSSRKLTFDSSKLTAALEKDPLAIRQLFVRDDAADPVETNLGVAKRMTAWLDNYVKPKGILEGEASAIQKNIDILKNQITRYQDQILPMREAQLRRQFVALEKAMTAFQNQGNWLSSQLKGLPGSSNQ